MTKAVQILISLGFIISISGVWSGPIALLTGIAMALICGNPYASLNKKISGWLIALAIVGLGAGIPLKDILKTGAHGILYTVLGIGLTLLAGWGLGRLLKVSDEVSCLITAGTAICGGSAIAAVSKVIGARADSVAVSLAIVFLLNAVALLIFPVMGHFFGLSQTQFGLWAGLAIHDTSSVVGASLIYGAQAAKVGTTVKLARALWIIPLSFTIGFFRRRQEDGQFPLLSIVKRCWFIGGFLAMAVLSNTVPMVADFSPVIEKLAKHMMTAALFLIGTGMTRDLLKQVGYKPFVQGVALWLIVSVATLTAILLKAISV